MKIVFFTHYSDLYGANKSLFELIINMRKLYDVEPIVIAPRIGELSYELEKEGIDTYCFKYNYWMVDKTNNKFKIILKYVKYRILNFIASIKIKNKLKNINVDIIHTNSSVIDIGAIVAKKLQIRHIWHIREFGKEDYNLTHYISPQKAYKFIINNSYNVICISQSLMEKYKKYLDSSKRLKLVYNGIDKNNYTIDIENKDFCKNFNIVFTGLISKKKNQMELLKAVEIIINKKDKKDIKIYYLGDGEQEYIYEMKKFCDDKNIKDNIFFEGKVKDVKKYISNSQIGVICSEKEAFGRVTVEYMMGGLAVIASNTGANPEIIRNNTDGILYELGNINELSDKIEYLYDNRDILKKLSFEAQETANKNFTSENNCRRIYSLYNKFET